MEDYGYPINRECRLCGWRGNDSELLCSLEDAERSIEANNIDFNLCPECESENVEEFSQEPFCPQVRG